MSATDLIIRKLLWRGSLSPQEKAAVEGMVVREREVPRHQDIVVQGSTPTESSLVIHGFAGRYKLLDEGQRQITAIHVPGDFVDLHSFLLSPLDHSVLALSDCRIGVVPHETLRAMTDAFPNLTRLMWLNTLVDGAIHREWLVAMGRRTATQHLAHLLCEFYMRLDAVGMTDGRSYTFPVTQAEVADTLGITPVHVNRTLQELRERDLVSWQGRMVTIKDWDALAAFSEFDPTYLNLGAKALPAHAA
jgi:CRP-like cAMP-binding protein